MKTQLIAGRAIDEHDLASLAKVAVVNEEFARRIAGGPNADGKHFRVEATATEPETSFEIIGIARNAKYHDLREDIEPEAFLPLSKSWLEGSYSRFVVRSRLPSAELTGSVRATLERLSPNIRYSFRSLDRWVQDSLNTERLMATVSAWFGGLALLLTSLGLYGVVSYMTALRTNEIGIRVALGASSGRIALLVMRETGYILGVGLIAGTALTLAVVRVGAALLFGLKPYDPLTLAGAAAILAFLAGVASYLPAWRATKVNPANALRND